MFGYVHRHQGVEFVAVVLQGPGYDPQILDQILEQLPGEACVVSEVRWSHCRFLPVG